MMDRERYQAAFAQVKAPADAAQRALDALPVRQAARRRRLQKTLALAVTAVLLMGTAAAELDNGGVSNLLAPVFGGAQTELIDAIGYPIGASCSADGYTVTADAVAGDRYNMYIAYTITRDDGQPLPEGVYFEELENSAYRGNGGGYRGPRSGEDGEVRYVEQWSSEGPVIGRNAEVTMEGLSVYDKETDTHTLLAQGPWTLKFTLRYKDTTRNVPVAEKSVTDRDGNTYEIQKVQLSALSVRVDMRAPAVEGGSYPDGFSVALLLKDGSTVSPYEHSGGAHGGKEDTVRESHCIGRFETPVLLEEVQAVLVCGTAFPVN